MKRIFFAIAITAFFIACQKENKPKENDPPANPTSPPDESAKLLAKMVDSNIIANEVYSIDSIVYFYDVAGRISGWRTYIADASYVGSSTRTYTRDDQGRTILIHDSGYSWQISSTPKASDTSIYGTTSEVHYQSGSDEINYVYRWLFKFGRSAGDSIFYQYDNGILVGTTTYTTSQGTEPMHFFTNRYSFNTAGDLVSFSVNTQDDQKRLDYSLTSDGKTNPLRVGVEEITDNFFSVCSDNLTHWGWTMPATGDSYNDPQMTYTYRNDGRPLTRAYLDGSQKTTYFYK